MADRATTRPTPPRRGNRVATATSYARGVEAAFFDLDKTVIAQPSMVAFGRPLYKAGMISRWLIVRAMAFSLPGITRAEMTTASSGWSLTKR